MGKKIIFLSGYAGSGKDTVGNILVKDYGYTRFAFADRLKQYVSLAHSIDRQLMETQEGKRSIVDAESKLTVRDILIREAAQSKKHYPDVWADFLLDDILDSKDEKIVVTDFRYPNEYDVVKKYYNNIITYRIHNPSIEVSWDPSEHQLDNFPFDGVIDNSADLDALRESVELLNL